MPSDSSSSPVLILGAGYTGRRVAQLLASCDMETVVTTRSSGQLQIPWVTSVAFEASTATDLSFIPVGARILYSIPALGDTPDPSPVLIGNLAQRRPTRVVYISTTGVYGEHEKV
ncbi:MAG: hypothetical protein H7039_07925, partial [Bryobacteraceae bacterium]|nr:hypothetical protein [Bryobacteraceae bacterium]